MARRGLVTIQCEFCGRSTLGRKGARFCSHSCVASATRPSIDRSAWQEIGRRYVAGETTADLAVAFGSDSETVRTILVRLDVPRRPRGVPGAPIGTRRQGKRGYVRIKTENGWKLEHRLVAENAAGRQLESDEHVHHEDGVRSNNDDTNLEVLTCAEHGREHHGVAPEVIAEIRRQYIEGVKARAICAACDVSVNTLYKYVADLPRRASSR